MSIDDVMQALKENHVYIEAHGFELLNSDAVEFASTHLNLIERDDVSIVGGRVHIDMDRVTRAYKDTCTLGHFMAGTIAVRVWE